jgi:hypothetical protein
MRAWGRFSIAALIGLTFGGQTTAAAQGIRFVPNVEEQFGALTVRPDAMGFELHGPDPSQCRHMQGLARIDGADGTPYLFVSRSGKDTGVRCDPWEGSSRSNIYIVKMGSRDKTGERMRSNRLRKGMETTDTPPEPTDLPIRSLLFDGTSIWPHYEHPGGMQVVGDVLALALEDGQSGEPPAKILFIDVSNPEEPTMLDKPFVPPFDKAGVLGITPCGSGRDGLPCATGHYLMLLSGGNNEDVFFYESNGDLRSPNLSWSLLHHWRKEELIGATWPTDKAHQTLQFIREGSLAGRLYVAGARSDGTIDGFYGDDYLDLYEVGFESAKVTLTHKATRHVISHPTGEGNYVASEKEVYWGDRLASFAAASGFHVTPTGELLFYATEHDNDGPEGSNGRASVKFGEWRHIDFFRPGSAAYLPRITTPGPVTIDEGSTMTLSASGRPPLARPWIQLFEELNFSFGSRFAVVELDDYDKDDFDNFRLLDRGYEADFLRFDNSASAWRWFAPAGCTIRANDQPVGGSGFPGPETKTLEGTGQREFNPSLHEVKPDSGEGEMFRQVGSVEFFAGCSDYYAAPVTLRWDLNFDGVLETVGETVTLSAEALDGPALLELTLQAQHSTDGSTSVTTIPVTVNNVAPVIQSWTLLTASGRRIGVDVPFVIQSAPVVGLAYFTDAGRLDTQTASVAWGDGSVSRSFTTFADAYGGEVGRLLAQYKYSAPGVYEVRVTVTDDDSGAGHATAAVTIVSPGKAVTKAVAMLDALITVTTDSTRGQLLAARSALAKAGQLADGNGNLTGAAVDLIASAMTQLQNARLSSPSGAEGIEPIEAVLAEIVAALRR